MTFTRSYTSLFTGIDVEVPTLDGGKTRYVNLDNAASTPSLLAVQEVVNRFLNYYSSVHRGTGFKSQLSTHAYERARRAVLLFVGGDPQFHTCIFVKNTTEALNKLARRFPFTDKRDVLLTSAMEHHSNDLPWRAVAKTIHAGIKPDGRLDEDDFDRLLEKYRDRLALVSITGASNVTGYLNPIHRLAEKTHAAGAQIAVDCAQLAPHRKVKLLSPEDPAHLDFVALSAHKLYAPFGSGALIGRRESFEQGDPDQTGGGTVEIVTLDDVAWTDPPEKEEAGSPNTVGAIAFGAAVEELEKVGMASIAEHEAELTAYALRQLTKIPGLTIYGDTDPASTGARLGVIPFEMDGLSHFLVASILGYEFGIGVRSGCFCAHPYILKLLSLSPDQAHSVRERILSGDKSNMPGLVRASFGLYNTFEDVDALVEALHRIALGEYQGMYDQDLASGEFSPRGWSPDFDHYFSFD